MTIVVNILSPCFLIQIVLIQGDRLDRTLTLAE